MLGLRVDHEVRVFVSNGAVVHFTLREMHALYVSWQMWVLVLVGFGIMSTGHPVTLPQFESFELRMAFWLIALFLYVVLSEVYSLLICKVWGRAFDRPIPLIILSTPLLMFATYTTGAILVLLFEPGRPPFEVMTWQMNLRNIFVAHVFETVALLWLIPAQRERRNRAQPDRVVTLAGRTLPLADIQRVKAAEHYLEIYNSKGTEVLRERIATFLEQVGPQDGIQTHRSHWVAADQAVELSGMFLKLQDGTKVPVARGRLNDVRDWVHNLMQCEERLKAG